MISNSVPFMTAFDIVIISLVIVSLLYFIPKYSNQIALKERAGFLLIISAMALIALFYSADLVVMYAFPLFMPMDKAMDLMNVLHLDYRWFVSLLCVAMLSIGFFRLHNSFGELLSEADAREDALRTELRTRVETESALQSSEALHRQAMELAGLGYCLWDCTTDTCLYCSEEYARIHGVSPEQYISLATTDEPAFNHPDDIEAYKAGIARVRRGDPFAMEYRIITYDGETRYVRELASPVFDDAGEVVREICTIQDITEEKNTEARLVQAQKFEAMGQLTSGVAHDVNNILSVVLGNVGLIGRKKVEGLEPLLEPIKHAAKIGAELTERLLAFTRQQPLHPASVDLGKLIEGLPSFFGPVLGDSIYIKTDVPSDLWRIHVDQVQLENALLNLAINARDAMPDGGSLVLSAENASVDAEESTGHAGPERIAGDYVILSVSDTGTGMPPEVLKKAVDPFFTTKAAGKGTGLGLATVYGYVHQSGGWLEINSSPGQGTNVELFLPKSQTG